MKILFERLPHARSIPDYKTAGAAGADISAAIHDPILIKPLGHVSVPSGLKIAIPDGYEGQLRARSGLAVRFGLTLVNGIGTIDSDYRDEILVPLINLGELTITIAPGERIAQLVIVPVAKAEWREVSNLKHYYPTSRRGGFGSTGK